MCYYLHIGKMKNQSILLLMVASNPAYVNQKRKFAAAGKIVPVRTHGGKMGLVKASSADLSDTVSTTIDIKIQQ